MWGVHRPSEASAPDESREWFDATDPNNGEKLLAADRWVRFLDRRGVGLTQFQHRDDPQQMITSPHVAIVLALMASQQVLVVANRESWELKTQIERAFYHGLKRRPYVHADSPDCRIILGLPNGAFRPYAGRSHGWIHDGGLYQCARCDSYYFLSEFGAWGCQANGCFASGNGDLGECFTERVPFGEWEAAS